MLFLVARPFFNWTQPFGIRKSREHVVDGDSWRELFDTVFAQEAMAPRMVFETPRLGNRLIHRRRNDVDMRTELLSFHSARFE